MKLVASPTGPTGSTHFRFMFAEFVSERSILFVYDSINDSWRSIEAEEGDGDVGIEEEEKKRIFLNVINGRRESVLVVCRRDGGGAAVVRRRLVGGGGGGDMTMRVGFSWGNVIDRLHVYGDGYMMIVESEGGDGKRRILKGIEMWGVKNNDNNGEWEFISKAPMDVMKKMERVYGVMMGCLEERDGVIRGSLVTNWEGVWDILWVSFVLDTNQWSWIPLPDCKMKGFNLAGISFSSGLTLP